MRVGTSSATRTRVLPEVTCVGVLPAQLRRSQSRSAMSAIRRLQPAGMRKQRTFANGVVSGSNRPRAEVPSVRTDLRRPPEAGIPRRPRDRQPLTQSGKLPLARRWMPASTAAVVARRSLMAPRSISQFIGSQSGCAAPSGLSQSRPANSLASASMKTRTFAARC